MKIKRFLCEAILTLFVFCSITTFLPVVSAQSGQPAGNTERATNDSLIKYTPLAPLPGVGLTETGATTTVDIISYARGIFKLAIGLAAALAVIMITVGGVEYIGSDTISSKESGREKINNALLGLFLAMGAWLILYTVNPKLVSLDFLVPEIPASTDSSTRPTVAGSRNIELQRALKMQNALRGQPENAVYKIAWCLKATPPGGRSGETYEFTMVPPSFPFDSQSNIQEAKTRCENTEPKGIKHIDVAPCQVIKYSCTTQNEIRTILQQPTALIPKERPDVPGWYFGFYYLSEGEVLEKLRYYGPLTEEQCRDMDRTGTSAVNTEHGQTVTQVYCREYTLDDL